MLSEPGKYYLSDNVIVIIIEKKKDGKFISKSEKLSLLKGDTYNITDIKEIKFKNKLGFVFKCGAFTYWIPKASAELFNKFTVFNTGDVVKVLGGIYDSNLGIIKKYNSDDDIQVYINEIGLVSFDRGHLEKTNDEFNGKEVNPGDEVTFKGGKKGLVLKVNKHYITVDCDAIQYKIRPFYIIDVKKLSNVEKQNEVEKRKDILRNKRIRQQLVIDNLNLLMPPSLSNCVLTIRNNISKYLEELKNSKADVIAIEKSRSLNERSVLLKKLFDTASDIIKEQTSLYSPDFDDYDPLYYKDSILLKSDEITKVIQKLNEIVDTLAVEFL